MTTRSWADRALALLRPKYPEWELWTVQAFPERGWTWHARPVHFPIATAHADTPEELVKLIALQDATAPSSEAGFASRQEGKH